MIPRAERQGRVLNISKRDAVGRRFNNLDAAPAISRHGWSSTFCCWEPPASDIPSVVQANTTWGRMWSPFGVQLEYHTGRMDRFFRNSPAITSLAEYQSADLLHFHIVHERWLSANDWRRLARRKAVVWTWHDPYFMTGHCIYPMDCSGYETGCKVCPHLNYHFPVRRDKARTNLSAKSAAIRKINPVVVVASDYMASMVRRSVYGSDLRVRVVPFGVEWPAGTDRAASRRELGIPQDEIVIGFRAVYSDYKGLPLIQAALANMARLYRNARITVIAFQEKNTLHDLGARWRVIEPGWISDSSIGKYYAAMDVFLMPSRAEAFGMMAIEALATGALPIVTYGTALPELVASPVHGMATEHSPEGFTRAVFDAVQGLNYWRQHGPERIAFARTQYSVERFAVNLARVYDEAYDNYTDHRRTAR